jgi:hypothetical protein
VRYFGRIALHRRGIPNFRQIGDVPLAALAQPSLNGIKALLSWFGAKDRLIEEETSGDGKTRSIRVGNGVESVTWINLREEPVIYMKNAPHLLRDYAHPFRTMQEFETGITPERCDELEQRLQDDILNESREYKSRVLVHEELPGLQLRAKWERVESREDCKSVHQVFDDLAKEGYRVDYVREPLHVEEAPGLQSLDRLCRLISDKLQDSNTTILFNCQQYE